MCGETAISSIIVVVEKDKKFLKHCLVSLEKSAKYAGISVQIIIIANGIIPDKPRYLKSKYSIFTFKKNVGFGNAVNFGIKKAKTEWCLVIAPDTITHITTLKYLLKVRNKKNIAIVGPKIVLKNGSIDHNIQPKFNLLTIFLEQSYLYKLFPKIINHPFGNNLFYNSAKNVNGLVSTYWLINRRIFVKIGGFDKRFFLYLEDRDLCQRLISCGYKILFQPKATVTHLPHQSTGGKTSGKLYFSSFKKYLEKNNSDVEQYLAIIIYILGCLLRYLYWNIKLLLPNNITKRIYINNKLIFYKEIFGTFFS